MGAARAHGQPRPAAFTRLELLAVLAVLALLAVAALPGWAKANAQSDRVSCLNNLRQLGMAIHRWGNDHNDLPPWWTPWCEGGSRVHSTVCRADVPSWYGLQNNLWFQLAFLTNDLASPRLLACPSDAVWLATDWSTEAVGGFMNPSYRNNAISYTIGLDANNPLAHPDFFSQAMLLAGDRNMQTNGVGTCATGVSRAAVMYRYSGLRQQSWWLPALHGLMGNVLFTDGHVAFLDTIHLTEALNTNDDNSSQHFLFPR